MKQYPSGQSVGAGRGVVGFTAACLLALAWPALALQVEQPPQEATEQAPDTAPDPTTEPAPDPTAGDAADPQPRPAGLEDELSNALRLRAELDAILTADGRLSADAGESGPTRLAGLSTRCAVLINSAMNDETRAVLLVSRARALAALTQFEYAANPAEPSRLRLDQLRVVADQISALDLPSAAPSADYWQLLADLADTERSAASLRFKRALAEQLLAGYIALYADLRIGAEYVADVRLSLARMLDERGDQPGALEQIDRIAALPADDPRLAEIERLRSRAARIGDPIAFEGLTTRLNYWQSARYLGKPILIHVYADSVGPSVALIGQMRRAIAAGDLADCTVVSLRLGEPVQGAPEPDWPVLPVDLTPGGVLDQLGVEVLPTLVWIDAQGRFASFGYVPAVLDQMPVAEPQPEPIAEPQSEQQPKPRQEAQRPDGTGPDAPLQDE